MSDTGGLVGWWPLHDDSAQDLSGNDNHGTLNGGVTTGVVGRGGLKAMAFNGSDSYVSLPIFSTIGPSDTFSVSVWVNAQNIPLSDSDDILHHQIDDSDRFALAFREGEIAGACYDGSSWQGASSYSNVTTNEWYHVVYTYDGSTQNGQIHVNTELGQGTQTSSTTVGVTGFDIGRRLDGSKYFEGVVFDLRVYDRVLTSSEIQTLYEWGNGDYARPPLEYFQPTVYEGFEEATSLDKYNGGSNELSLVTGPINTVGVQGLELASDTSGYTDSPYLTTDVTVSRGETFSYRWYNPGSNNGGILFGNQTDDPATFSGAGVLVNSGSDIFISDWTNGSASHNQVQDTGSMPTDTTLLITVEWATDDTITVKVTSLDGSVDYGGGSYNVPMPAASGGLGWNAAQETSYADHAVTVRPMGVARYPLDGNTNDVWGTNDGTNNGVTFVDDSIRGQAGEFDYTNADRIDTGITDSLSQFSVGAWVKYTDEDKGWNVIIGKDYWDNNNGWALAIDDNNAGNPLKFCGPNFTNIEITHTSSQNWCFVFIVYNGSTLKAYVNGSLVKTANITINPSSTDYTIGARHTNDGTGNSDYFSGLIDDVRIYDRALEPWEIFELYQWGTFGRDMRHFTVNQ